MRCICAVNSKFYIGKDGEMMWRSKEDFKHFKSKTMGGILIVGSTTFEQDLKGRMLPGRTTIVVGNPYKNPNYHTLWDAVKMAILEQINNPEKEIWVIGGASIYEQLLPLCTELHISQIDNDSVGDRKFPSLQKFRGKIFKYEFKEDLVA